MNQDQGIQQPEQNLLNQFVQKYHSKMDKFKNLMNSNNTTAIFIIGKSRVGKSSIFHILRGDELGENEEEQMNVKKGQSLIGIEDKSFTKIPNFHNYNITLDDNTKVSIDLIDTPGYQDNQEIMDEIISQIQLLQLLQNYQKIIFAVVTQHDSADISYIKKPLLFAENLIKKQIDVDDNNFFDDVSICLIVNKFQSKNKDGPKKQIQNEIEKDEEEKRYPVSKQLLRKIEQSLFLIDKCPDCQKQQCLNQQFQEFVRKNLMIKNKIGYKLSFEESSSATIQNLLSDEYLLLRIIYTQNKVWNKVVEISEEILKKYSLNQEENQIFEDICKQLVNFFTYEDWNNLYVFFGNPLSGKSTAINLLCKIPHQSKLFDNVLMNLHHGVLPKGIYNLLEYGKNAKNLFIEFQSFSQQYLVLLQYFYTYCQKNNRRFSISIVLNADMTLQNEIQIALDEFFQLNQITDYNCLNFIVNIKEGTNFPEKIEINFNQQRIELQKNQYQKIFTIQSQFNEDFINISRLNFFQQNQTGLNPQKFINLAYLFQKNLEYLIQAFNLNCAKLKIDYKFINNQDNEKNINLFLKLLRLNPNNENFQIELNNIQQMFGNFQISGLNQRNHQKLKKLFEILIENHQLFDKIKELSKFLQNSLKSIELHSLKYSKIFKMNQTDILNFLNDALIINPNFLAENDKKNLKCLKLFYNQFFDPSYSSNNGINIKNCIKNLYHNYLKENNLIVRKFYDFVNQVSQKPFFNVNLFNNSNLNLFKEFNLFQFELFNLIYQLQQLMDLIKETQKKGYISLDYWLFPFGIYYKRFDYWIGDKYENEQIKQQSDAVTQNIKNMSFITGNRRNDNSIQ